MFQKKKKMSNQETSQEKIDRVKREVAAAKALIKEEFPEVLRREMTAEEMNAKTEELKKSAKEFEKSKKSWWNWW